MSKFGYIVMSDIFFIKSDSEFDNCNGYYHGIANSHKIQKEVAKIDFISLRILILRMNMM